MIRDINFLGTTMVGCIVYLSLTIFCSIMLLSSMMLMSCFYYQGFQLFNAKCVLLLLFSQFIKIEFFHVVASWVWYPFNVMNLFTMFSTMLSSVASALSLPLSWYRPMGLSLDIVSTTTFFLLEMCSNRMSNCCSFRAQWSSTGLDIPVVKNGASSLWLQ